MPRNFVYYLSHIFLRLVFVDEKIKINIKVNIFLTDIVIWTGLIIVMPNMSKYQFVRRRGNEADTDDAVFPSVFL